MATPLPTPAPNANLAAVAAGLRSAPYVGRLLDVLAHPVAQARPDLRHFEPAADGAAGQASPPEPADGLELPPASAAGHGHGGGRGVIVLELLIAAVAATGALRLRTLAGPRSRWLLITAVLAAVLPGSGLGPPAPDPHSTAASVPRGPAIAAPSPAAPGPVAAAPTTWTRLVDIERRLAAARATIAAEEWDIGHLAVVAGRHLDDPGAIAPAPAAVLAARARLATLLAAHDAVTAGYHRDLQAEYDLYRTAAVDPAQRNQLTSAAAHFPTPDAPVAVNANLGVMATQLAQEAALADAQERLRRLEALLPAQIAAIRHRRPFITPEVAAVSQTFGPTDLGIEPPLTYDGTFYPHFHTGIDLAGPDQTPLHAAADGVVLIAAASTDSAGRLVGYGNYVVIGHAAGFLTLYGHMSQVAVHAGDRVGQGQVIGFEGSTGNSTGPHVHFEIRRNDALLDPAPFLDGQLPAG
ncbi:MAG TPA: M23 family metallopeptidase [Candidatus Dormibacteraeota bacterium]|nr:M23 family metallopeptidase [Candidatus Dormibacteraeota bacterium]